MIKIFKNNVKSYVLQEVNVKQRSSTLSLIGNILNLNPNICSNTQVFGFVSMKPGKPTTIKVFP